ncbi:hypothetical protein JX265_010020 [Neoarthrinium moseri]|uniref:Peptide N-acetyl-beta-D-glucosaminyl asparaginase amidase A N-terminal domain-containing protein n=1 Tax=Neoarthrinium moseri TaxID=1658444 RepID=A0A9P9WEW8_9PEZI|nr:hypothetical protein JX265_010020 [Neoarthrinium moseri]
MLSFIVLLLIATVLVVGSDERHEDKALEVFQAANPPRKTFDDVVCRQTIVQHVFENSYGAPFAGTYTPPHYCDFTTVVLNLSATSQGRQHDRLALLYFNDVEIWRTSTPTPTQSGIHWSYVKDITIFRSLLDREQKVIFDLPNAIDGNLYTGAFNVTIEALYFNDEYQSGFTPAEEIFAISNLTSAQNTPSVFNLPGDSGVANLTLPRNIKNAVVSIMASGNGAEEFWFANVPSEYTDTFSTSPLGPLSGHSPFREVQLLIDGQLAGISWPFPIIFTTGIDPGAWRPIVGLNAYDLPSFEVDVTPWLSLLCDGQAHSFQLQVVGYDSLTQDNIGTVGDNWWVSASLFVWLDHAVNETEAGPINKVHSGPTFDFEAFIGTEISSNGSVSNTSFSFSLAAERSLSITSTRATTNGTRVVSWHQHLSYISIQNLTNSALNQTTSAVTSGSHYSDVSDVVSRYVYPLTLYSSYDVSPEGPVIHPGSVLCMVDRSAIDDGVNLLQFYSGVEVGTKSLVGRQNITSKYYWNDTIVEGTGSNNKCNGETWFTYSGAPAFAAGVKEYSRYLRESDDAIVADQQAWTTIVVPNTIPIWDVEG